MRKKIIWFSVGAVFLDWFLQYQLMDEGWGVMNRGVSWGLFSGFGLWFGLASLVCMLAYSLKIVRIEWGLWLVVVGGVGNLVPRLLWGGIWDYLSFGWFPFWFNISDVLILFGTVSYILLGSENQRSIRR